MKSALLDTASDGNRMRVCTGTGPTQTEGRSLFGQRARGVLPDSEAAIDRCSREAGPGLAGTGRERRWSIDVSTYGDKRGGDLLN